VVLFFRGCIFAVVVIIVVLWCLARSGVFLNLLLFALGGARTGGFFLEVVGIFLVIGLGFFQEALAASRGGPVDDKVGDLTSRIERCHVTHHL
jgi:hypothetical protein